MIHEVDEDDSGSQFLNINFNNLILICLNFEGMDFEEFLEMMAKKVFDLNKDRVLNQNTLKLHD